MKAFLVVSGALAASGLQAQSFTEHAILFPGPRADTAYGVSWVRQPSPQQLRSSLAPDVHQEGAIRLSCSAGSNGTLHSCKVSSSSPANFRYAGVVEKITPLYRISKDDAAAASRNRSTVNFNVYFQGIGLTPNPECHPPFCAGTPLPPKIANDG